MPQTPREIVRRSLKFEHPERMPRDLWLLPWAEARYPGAVAEIRRRFPQDFCPCGYQYYRTAPFKDQRYAVGTYTDEWGCVFTNIQSGVIGEVKTPQVRDIADWKLVKPPYDQLPRGRGEVTAAYDAIGRFYEATDKFVLPDIWVRPWERYQFLRGSENALMDLAMPEPGVRELLARIHDYYLREIEFWARSQIDAIPIMDDWGAQSRLLVNPSVWREMFKPLYREYCELAHAHGKFALMHSDGHILDIYEDLIEIGVDAVNSQLFCMDMSELARRAKGKITFWGEIDRQHVLPSPDPSAGREAVRKVARHFYDRSGGIIAQFEFGAGADPQTAVAVFEEWELFEKEI